MTFGDNYLYAVVSFFHMGIVPFFAGSLFELDNSGIVITPCSMFIV